jgi:uncharacterized protein (DUF2345 family)
MTIITQKNLYIEAKDTIKMVCAGNVMDFIKDDGISVNTDGVLTTGSDKETNMTSGKDMKLDSGSNLIESAETEIDLAAAGSSMIMKRSGIDLRGNLIKEN